MKTITKTLGAAISLIASLAAKASNPESTFPKQSDESNVQSLRPEEIQDSKTLAILNMLCSSEEISQLNNHVFIIENGKIKILGKKGSAIRNGLEVEGGHSCIME